MKKCNINNRYTNYIFFGPLIVLFYCLLMAAELKAAPIVDFLPKQPLFTTLAAGFDQPSFQARLRYGDNTFDKYTPQFKKLDNAARYLGHACLVAGEDYPLMNVDTGGYGITQIGITGMIRAIFGLQYYSGPNLNNDFKISFPVTYGYDTWTARFAFFHISCHAGDELIVSNPGFERINTSREGLEFFVSKYFFEMLRIYTGATTIVRSDRSSRLKTFMFENGIEFKPYLPKFFTYAPRNFIPYTAFHIRTWQQYDWSPDLMFVLGLELSGSIASSARLLRIFGEYYHGHSPDGQFLNTPTDYFGAGLSFGF